MFYVINSNKGFTYGQIALAIEINKLLISLYKVRISLIFFKTKLNLISKVNQTLTTFMVIGFRSRDLLC